MIRPSPPRFVALACIGALVAAGCSASTLRDAATLRYDDPDGAERVVHVGRDDLRDELDALFADEDASTVATSQSADWLTQRLYYAAAEILFEQRGLDVDDASRTQAEQAVDQQYPDLPADVRDSLVGREAQLRALLAATGDGSAAPEPTDEDARAFYEDNIDEITRCESGKEVSHILVETEGEAAEVAAELAAGASFADLARARSIDPSAAAGGGSLGCLGATPFVEEFQAAADAAPVGEVVGPVQTQFGFHLILVSEWDPSFERLRDQILDFLRRQAEQEAGAAPMRALLDAIGEIFASADVRIDPRFGRWEDVDGQWQVVPPDVPQPREQREPSDDAPDADVLVPPGGGGG